jgi:hypothetical protein
LRRSSNGLGKQTFNLCNEGSNPFRRAKILGYKYMILLSRQKTDVRGKGMRDPSREPLFHDCGNVVRRTSWPECPSKAAIPLRGLSVLQFRSWQGSTHTASLGLPPKMSGELQNGVTRKHACVIAGGQVRFLTAVLRLG